MPYTPIYPQTDHFNRDNDDQTVDFGVAYFQTNPCIYVCIYIVYIYKVTYAIIVLVGQVDSNSKRDDHPSSISHRTLNMRTHTHTFTAI